LIVLVASGCRRRIQEEIKRMETQIGAMDISQGLTPDSMLRGVEASAFINAPPEEVYAFCSRTENFRVFFPGEAGGKAADDPDAFVRPGDNINFVYGDMPGAPKIPGRMVVTRVNQGRSLEMFFVGPIWSRIQMYVKPEGDGTRITFRNMYQITELYERIDEDEFVMAVSIRIWQLGLRLLPVRMGLGKAKAKDEIESRIFTVYCNTHRASAVSGDSPKELWERAVRTDFISEILGDKARLAGGDDTIDELGRGFDLETTFLNVHAVTVNAIPYERLHMTLFLDDIKGGVLALFKPEDGGTRIELLFYYEIPSDETMPPELLMAFATAPEDLESVMRKIAE
jgi:hypothetical protein